MQSQRGQLAASEYVNFDIQGKIISIGDGKTLFRPTKQVDY